MEFALNSINRFNDENFNCNIQYLSIGIKFSIENYFFEGKEFQVCNVVNPKEYLVLHIQKPENGKALKYFIKNNQSKIFQFKYDKGWVLNEDSNIKRTFRSDAPDGFVSKFIELKKV